MTADAFLAFYPQFGGVFPEIVVSSYVEEANLRFADFGEDAEAARRLYIAHRLTLYAKTMPGSMESGSGRTASYSSLASAGDGSRITSKKVDGVAVTYASGTSASGSAESELTDFTETIYGLQLLSMMRMYSYTRYIP